MKRRWLVPEVIQTSAMDCGPAALKAIMGGFGLNVSYGRLRETCHTDVDGTSIDTIEELAVQLGLDAAQVMVPVDHLVLPEAEALPCIVVVRMEGGGNHFVVAWRRHGSWLQVMDPAVGRRWVRSSEFLSGVYLHEQEVPVDAWLEWFRGPAMAHALRARLRNAGVSKPPAEGFLSKALASDDWRSLAALDAAIHLAQSLKAPSLVSLVDQPELIPADYWRVKSAGPDTVIFKGAVAMQATGVKERQHHRDESVSVPGELWKVVRKDGFGLPLAAVLGSLVAAVAVLAETLFLRSLFTLTPHFPRAGERLSVVAILVGFLACLALVEWGTEDLLRTAGRRLEVRLRTQFCLKIPRLGDRYFQSRLISDMAQRAHAVQILRDAPSLAVNLLRALVSLAATVCGIVWFFPAATLQAVLCGVVSMAVPILAQPWLLERDLRFREHAGGLSRFYLDALLGIVPIRAHGAGPALRASQSVQLGHWAAAGLRMQRSLVSLDGIQLVLSYGTAAWLVWTAMQRNGNPAALILLVYWALSIPEFGKTVSATLWQWPGLRNGFLRFFEPLGSPEESVLRIEAKPRTGGVRIEMRDLEVSVCGRPILSNVNLMVEPGEHIGIVGPSGAGKSSLVGLLLGWHRVNSGDLLIDGEALNAAELRRETAWVDPQVQIWNESLIGNLSYGLDSTQPLALGRAVESANLSRVIENLPGGMQTPLGEGGALLSGGEGQRVRMARAYGKPNVRLAILDEPARGLDRDMRDEFARRAREAWKDATLLSITHDVASTRSFPRVLVIENGGIAEDGDPAELYARTDSRYRQLCDREDEVRNVLWNAASWRRLRMDGGRLT